jgi:hypothetical protein
MFCIPILLKSFECNLKIFVWKKCTNIHIFYLFQRRFKMDFLYINVYPVINLFTFTYNALGFDKEVHVLDESIQC